MELKTVLLTLLKILISTRLVGSTPALMGGHIDNHNHSASYEEYDYAESSEDSKMVKQSNVNEKIPNPSPLVLPGYNLPETIFNSGKPFYAEKDPVTGKVDLEHKTPTFKTPEGDSYEYLYDDNTSDDIYNKKNIDRKDGSFTSSHKQADINQLTPNFHDFLNLPVKYNPEKYVYPLISSSYASTKIQGSVNKYHNHKDTFGVQKTTTTKPYSTTQSYHTYRTTQRTMATTPVSTTISTTTRPTTVRRYPELTTSAPESNNLLNSGMSHPSFSDEYEYEDEASTSSSTTAKSKVVYLTSEGLKEMQTTTKRTLSLFEQLFGEYDETVSTTEATKIPLNTTTASYPNIHAGPHKIVTPSTVEYSEEDYSEEDNVPMENKLHVNKPEDQLTVEPLKPITKLTPVNKTIYEERYTTPSTTTTTTTSTTTTTTPTSTTTRTTTTIASPTTYKPRVTSLPLGENHISPPINRDPIIVATQNLREKLNSEKVPQVMVARPQLHPSFTNIHVAPGQDTVSFVVGQHQSVGEEGQYQRIPPKDNIDNKTSRPLPFPQPELEVTIQPMRSSEASLSIGSPVNRVNKVPGQVMDASLEENHFPKPSGGGGNKVVFPDDKPVQSNVIPPDLRDREVLKLNSEPTYHQLPSDLTPPKENQVGGFPQNPMRPPWDPRPGHFYTGKPEYASRPSRPHPEVAYKRIDNLPNILPQFRPNMKKPHHPPMMGPPHFYYDQRFNRQPLLERPSNKPVGYYPPPHPNMYKRYHAPPPPPPSRNILRGGGLELEERRPLAQQPPQSLEDTPMAEDRIINEDPRRDQELDLYQTPPNLVPNRRHGEGEVETLQMIQAKNEKENEEILKDSVRVVAQEPEKTTDKTIYKVYPVNTASLIDVEPSQNAEETNDFNYKQHDRNDAPILKPHSRPVSQPGKLEFPYPLERPTSPSITSNQWNSFKEDADARIVPSAGKVKYATNQISATLKTYTEKPIAIAYTPTEPNLNADKYSMPNYGSPVIPEIRPGSVYPEKKIPPKPHRPPPPPPPFNHRIDMDMDSLPPKLDFQAPFQASVKLDASTNQGWSVVRDKNKTTTEETEVTTLPLATTSEFDIENFKPQLIGGFKPLYSVPEGEKVELDVADREEK